MSGIYIKGMEMPKKGSWVTLRVFPDGQCFLYSWCGNDFDFMEHLTAVPVPEHGRLGDLDAAVEKLKRLREFHADDSRSAPFIVAGINQCIDILSGREAPTIIPADKDGEG